MHKNKTIKYFAFTAPDIKALRKMTGLTQQQAAEVVHRQDGAQWRRWEAGVYTMAPELVELFCIKNDIPYPPKIPKRYYD